MKQHLRWATRAMAVLYTVLFFLFALFSGAEPGQGLKGIILNSPNALPWLVLGLFILLAWKEEFIGGSIIAVFGLITIFYFDTYKNLVAFMIISFPLLLIGVLFVLNHHIRKNKKKKSKK